MSTKPEPPPFPNRLRELRESRVTLTREVLMAKTVELAESAPELHDRVSLSTIRNLELGLSRPRRVTALTLASALDSSVEEVFPNGLDTLARNPKGVTRIEPDRKKGGRPKKYE